MTKIKFLLTLHERLANLPQDDVEERLSFYTEMIEDRMEEGVSEEDAVAAVGSVEQIAAQIEAEITSGKIDGAKEKAKVRLRPWQIVCLILGSPVWLSLLIAMVATVVAVYAALWSVIVSLWAVFASLVGCSVGAVVAGVAYICAGNVPAGVALIGAGVLCAGLSVFAFLGCRAATKGLALLTQRCSKRIKTGFVKKEDTR